MSLWLQSLSYCLDNSGNDLESRAKCILSYLSMDTPRLWWEQALETNSVDSSYANILHDLHKELLTIAELTGKIDTVLLIALAFTDKEGIEPKFGVTDSSFSVEEYLDEAKMVLTEKPELKMLARMIDKANHHR